MHACQWKLLFNSRDHFGWKSCVILNLDLPHLSCILNYLNYFKICFAPPFAQNLDFLYVILIKQFWGTKYWWRSDSIMYILNFMKLADPPPSLCRVGTKQCWIPHNAVEVSVILSTAFVSGLGQNKLVFWSRVWDMKYWLIRELHGQIDTGFQSTDQSQIGQIDADFQSTIWDLGWFVHLLHWTRQCALPHALACPELSFFSIRKCSPVLPLPIKPKSWVSREKIVFGKHS